MVNVWQKRLGLSQCRLTIEFDSDLENAEATTSSHIYDEAHITFGDYKEWDRRHANEVVVHELLHVCHRRIDRAIETLEEIVHRDAWTIHWATVENATEVFIDRQARVLVKLGGEV